MNRQQFNSRNNIGNVITFQKSGATASFDPSIAFSSGSRRVSWKLNNGSGTTQIAGNSITYTGFTSDSNIRNIEMRCGNLTRVSSINFTSDNIFGLFDISSLTDLSGGIILTNNSLITGVTNPPSSQSINTYRIENGNLQGNLDMTPLSGLGGTFAVYQNSGLTSITHSLSNNNFSNYLAYACGLTGNLTLPFSGLGGAFNVSFNSNLTGITHYPSSNNFTLYFVNNCGLIGNLNLSVLSGLGGSFQAHSNSSLTGITFGPSTNTFSTFYIFGSNLTNNIDLSPLSGLGGTFYLQSNPNLTSITHSSSSVVFNEYNVRACNLIENHNISMLQNIGSQIDLSDNLLLTGVTFPPSSSRGISNFTINTCDIQGAIDLTPFTGFGSSSSSNISKIKINANSGLTNVIFPESNGLYYKNVLGNILNAAFGMYACSLGYVDFKPLSGSTLISGATNGIPRFELFGNGMTTTEVNHILSDFDLISSLNYSGWTSTSGTSGAYVDISGNSAPDGSSGGYNGTGATINLISKGWTIITD